MRRLLALSVLLAFAVACVDKNPSWMIHWENEPSSYGEQEEPKPQTDTTDGPDTPVKPGDGVKLSVSFNQDFDRISPEGFDFRLYDGKEDFRYFSAFPSFSEAGTDILLLRLNPDDAAGPGNGPRLTLDSLSFYGSYSIRVRMPDLSKLKSKTDAVFQFGVEGLGSANAPSAISMVWKLSDPSKLTLYAVAGTNDSPVNTELEISVAEVLAKDFNAASRLYSYGFDWKDSGVEWWMINPSTKAKTVLAKTDALTAVPKIPAILNAGAWHTSSAPKYPFELEIDSIEFESFE